MRTRAKFQFPLCEKRCRDALEMRSGLEEHEAGGAIRCYTGVSPKHPFPTPSAESALLQHSHARASQKRTPPLMQFGPFFSCFAGIIGWKQFRERDPLALFSCLCLFVVSRESDTTCHLHADSISRTPRQSAHSYIHLHTTLHSATRKCLNFATRL
jgi:hypothetical protein